MVFYEFSLVISCILFRSHAKIVNGYFPSTYGSMRVLLHLYEIIGVSHRPEKGRYVLSKGSQPYLLMFARKVCHHGARIVAPEDNPEPL
jgi:hypothetical protein